MTLLLAVLVSPAAFLSVTVTRVRILRFSFRTRRFLAESLILSVTLPLAGTLKERRASETRSVVLLPRLTSTFLTLLKPAAPVSAGPAWKLKRKRPLRSTRIDDLEPAKLAFAGAVAPLAPVPVAPPEGGVNGA